MRLTGGRAHLALVEEDAKHDPLNGGIQICVLENEHRAFASQLQGHLHREVVSAVMMTSALSPREKGP